MFLPADAVLGPILHAALLESHSPPAGLMLSR